MAGELGSFLLARVVLHGRSVRLIELHPRVWSLEAEREAEESQSGAGGPRRTPVSGSKTCLVWSGLDFAQRCTHKSISATRKNELTML